MEAGESNEFFGSHLIEFTNSMILKKLPKCWLDELKIQEIARESFVILGVNLVISLGLIFLHVRTGFE